MQFASIDKMEMDECTIQPGPRIRKHPKCSVKTLHTESTRADQSDSVITPVPTRQSEKQSENMIYYCNSLVLQRSGILIRKVNGQQAKVTNVWLKLRLGQESIIEISQRQQNSRLPYQNIYQEKQLPFIPRSKVRQGA